MSIFSDPRENTIVDSACGERRLLQLNERDEFLLQAYKNAKLYKEKTKRWHGKKITNRHFESSRQVLLYNSRLKLCLGKLKSRMTGPFRITKVFPHGVVEIEEESRQRIFKVNRQQIKHYWGELIDCQKSSITLSDPS